MPRLTRTALAVALIVAAAAPGVLGRGYPCYSGYEKNATDLGWGGLIGVLLPSAFTGCALRCSSCLAQCAATCCCSVASPRLFSAMMTDTGPCHRRVCCGSADGVFSIRSVQGKHSNLDAQELQIGQHQGCRPEGSNAELPGGCEERGSV